ncbi:unnamed protein product [Closterium sp. Naga37s-1]|nr:unnamed protein product [Closterium sp. Naga37s-1]
MAPPARAAVPDATAARHLTVDGDVGLSDDAARSLARGFFLGGFLLLPWLWFVNCYFFWPVLRYNAGHDPLLRSFPPLPPSIPHSSLSPPSHVVGSAIGCSFACSLPAFPPAVSSEPPSHQPVLPISLSPHPHPDVTWSAHHQPQCCFLLPCLFFL